MTLTSSPRRYVGSIMSKDEQLSNSDPRNSTTSTGGGGIIECEHPAIEGLVMALRIIL